jgi:acetyl-CoA acetyltransferase
VSACTETAYDISVVPQAAAVIRDKTAIVGLGATPYYKRGTSTPQTLEELVGKSILAAVNDAGLKVQDIDGFAYFAGGFDTALLARHWASLKSDSLRR